MIGIAKKKTNEGISSYLGINDQVFGNLMIGEQAESFCHPWIFAAFVYPKALKLGHSQNKGPKLMSMYVQPCILWMAPTCFTPCESSHKPWT